MQLEQELFKSVEEKTPQHIKELDLIDLSNPEAFTFTLTKKHIQDLGLKEWFAGYEKEAKVSTAGIRGPQNILYPQDTRFPINLIGITLATVAKALVARGKCSGEIVKIAGREVRYNSELYLDAIARIQAANGIKTLVKSGTMPIWMASFLAFKLDLFGGEYITSSHGISVKNATKDLNSQGSQYLPEESMEFVDKIREILDETERTGSYKIKFSAKNDPLIENLKGDIDLYAKYLKSGVAGAENLGAIKSCGKKIIIENVGGCAYATLNKVLEKLGIADKYDWFNTEEDPFFHGIGKYDHTPDGKKAFYDYSVDATVVATRQDGTKFFPVIETMGYDKKLAGKPSGTVVLITDPDHDRLTITQTEPSSRIPELERLGIDYVRLDEDTVLTVFSANQAFLMLMDFQGKGKSEQGARFMIKTTASALSWDEWAAKNGVKVVNVPVGFKEIANIMKKVESQVGQNVKVADVFGNVIELGKNPKLLFAGEESGGMIMGTEELVRSQCGRSAVAMREKSAAEAIIVASALTAELKDTPLSAYLEEIFDKNSIVGRFDTRVDISYYNESEPDIEKLKQSKILGEAKRTKNDLFYLSLAIALREGVLGIIDIRTILNDAFKSLIFDNLKAVKFVGDGTYLEFTDKFIEIRPSGTDAKTKAYGGGSDKRVIELYAGALGNYSGERTQMHRKFISDNFYAAAKDKAMSYYLEFVNG